MGKVLMAGIVPPLTVPVNGIRLADIAEGQIIMIPEGDVLTPFYLAKHDYESGLNGAGRVLLVRKDAYSSRQWHSASTNAYASSAVSTWLNGTYKALLDAAVQNAIGVTKFRYTTGNGSTGVTTLERSVFLLSVTELGKSASYANVEGSSLPIASTLQVAYLNGSKIVQWTRTPYTNSTQYGFVLTMNGTADMQGVTSNYGVRPCFTLPSYILTTVNKDGTVNLMI